MVQAPSCEKSYCPEEHGSVPLQPPLDPAPPPADMYGPDPPKFWSQKVPALLVKWPKLPSQAVLFAQMHWLPVEGAGAGPDAGKGAGTMGGAGVGAGCCGMGAGSVVEAVPGIHCEYHSFVTWQTLPASQHVCPDHPCPPH
mmetsp:Transcript_130182/g.316296  ORF Transcript_130182/g.316296 Transcript_130182/m.316296 type:complete len:141 (-) Transcript_130182:202-624(-)